jgi:hypothetical protein
MLTVGYNMGHYGSKHHFQKCDQKRKYDKQDSEIYVILLETMTNGLLVKFIHA